MSRLRTSRAAYQTLLPVWSYKARSNSFVSFPPSLTAGLSMMVAADAKTLRSFRWNPNTPKCLFTKLGTLLDPTFAGQAHVTGKKPRWFVAGDPCFLGVAARIGSGVHTTAGSG